MRLLAVFLVLLSCVFAACGDDEPQVTEEPAATATAEEGTCPQVEAPAAKADGGAKKPGADLDASKTWTATVQTSCGDFTIELDVKRAPKTASSFASLAEQGFYDDTVFHRIVAGFVIQGGDPTGTGTGGPGYSVQEAPPSDLQYSKGVVAMAKTGAEPAGTSGSQFYVVSGDATQLPPEYALVGKVTEGMDVVETIGGLGDAAEQPTQPIVIESVKIASS